MRELTQLRSPWSLQRRMVLGIVALLALISIVIGVASVLTLRQLLIQRLDTQLSAAMERSQTFVLQLNPGLSDQPPGVGEAQGAGTLGLIIQNGVILAPRYLDESANIRVLSTQQQELLLAVRSSSPVTVQLGGTLGSYRVVTASTLSGLELIVGLPEREVDATTRQLLLVISVVSVLGIALAAAIAMFVVRVALKPLGEVVATASRVAELELDRGEVALAERVPSAHTNSTTEVGQVGAALNRLLEHVAGALTARQVSESKVRQFVADASHELRTPLASIRGYSELTRRSDDALPPDAVKALARIESESIRMTALVEELLLLARLDEDTELTVEPVDIAALAHAAMDDAEAAAIDHRWKFVADGSNFTAAGDQTRLYQAIANVLANAHIHTPTGTTVSTSVTESDDHIVVVVADDGPGIPPAVLPVLFERFVRGDSSRSRVTGSTGLGLAITKAIIEGHSGNITVTSEPGDTRFTIILPKANTVT